MLPPSSATSQASQQSLQSSVKTNPLAALSSAFPNVQPKVSQAQQQQSQPTTTSQRPPLFSTASSTTVTRDSYQNQTQSSTNANSYSYGGASQMMAPQQSYMGAPFSEDEAGLEEQQQAQSQARGRGGRNDDDEDVYVGAYARQQQQPPQQTPPHLQQYGGIGGWGNITTTTPMPQYPQSQPATYPGPLYPSVKNKSSSSLNSLNSLHSNPGPAAAPSNGTSGGNPLLEKRASNGSVNNVQSNNSSAAVNSGYTGHGGLATPNLIDILGVPPLPDTSDDHLDSSNYASSPGGSSGTPPGPLPFLSAPAAAANGVNMPPAPIPYVLPSNSASNSNTNVNAAQQNQSTTNSSNNNNSNSNNPYSNANPVRRQFLPTHSLAYQRPGSPLRHESFSASSLMHSQPHSQSQSQLQQQQQQQSQSQSQAQSQWFDDRAGDRDDTVVLQHSPRSNTTTGGGPGVSPPIATKPAPRPSISNTNTTSSGSFPGHSRNRSGSGGQSGINRELPTPPSASSAVKPANSTTTTPPTQGQSQGQDVGKKAFTPPKASNQNEQRPTPPDFSRQSTNATVTSSGGYQTGMSGTTAQDRSLPLREDNEWNHRSNNPNINNPGSGERTTVPSVAGSAHVTPTPTPPLTQAAVPAAPPAPTITASTSNANNTGSNNNPNAAHIVRRAQQYSPEQRIHAPRAVPLIDFEDFEPHALLAHAAAAAAAAHSPLQQQQAYANFLARAPSALSMGYGMGVGVPVPGGILPVPGYYYPPPPAAQAQYYNAAAAAATSGNASSGGSSSQLPMYSEFVNLPPDMTGNSGFMDYYTSLAGGGEDDDEEEEDQQMHMPPYPSHEVERGRQGGSPTPSSTLMHGLTLDESSPQQRHAQSQTQSQVQGSSSQMQRQPSFDQRHHDDQHNQHKRSNSQPRKSGTATGSGTTGMPGYDEYAASRGQSHAQGQQQQQSRHQDEYHQHQHQQHQQHHHGHSHSHSQSKQNQAPAAPLTRANLRANAGDIYEPYDPVMQHAMWFLEQQRQRVLYQPHPQALPAAFLDEFSPIQRFPEDDSQNPQGPSIEEPQQGRHGQSHQTSRSNQNGGQQASQRAGQGNNANEVNARNGGASQHQHPDRPQSATSSHFHNTNVRRPDAPIPPTPQSSTFFPSVAPTPYPLVFSPIPGAGSAPQGISAALGAPPLAASGISATPAPLRNTAGHPQQLGVPSRREFVEPALPTSTTAAAPPSPIQMQRYYPGGPRYYPAPPPSIPSTAMSSPFTGPINPFIRSHLLQGDRESVVSSPSHFPLPLPVRSKVKKNKKAAAAAAAGASTAATGTTNGHAAKERPSATATSPGVSTHAPAVTGAAATQRGPREPPARVASTVPPSSDTDQEVKPDEEDDGDLTEGRDDRFRTRSAPPLSLTPVAGAPSRFRASHLAAALAPHHAYGARSSTDDDEESELWEEEEEESDFLDNEMHPTYVQNPTKRNRKFQDKLGEMIRLFNEMDRTTDATMLLFISQPDGSPAGTHMLSSRNVRRSTRYMASANAARASFSQISASRRRIVRKRKLEAELRARQEERLSTASGTTLGGDLSPTSSNAAFANDLMRKNVAQVEALAERAEGQGVDGLKVALRTTLDTLRQMHKISEEREERRRDEAARQRREAAQMEELLQSLSH
ncbi:hypothetical protein DL93DRAFT_435516 [Clavulina sp. PMI_390]|nr:hypothetical protein DL93DRAFT_435516 [Clavulina sp. PMI_390]